MFLLNRFSDFFFWVIQMYLSGVPPPPPSTVSAPTPSGHQFFSRAGGRLLKQDSRGSLSKQITRKINIVISERIRASFFFLALLRLSHQETPRQLFSSKKDFQNGAGAKCCRGEEGVCEDAVCVETCAYEVSAGRNIETAQPVIIISHPRTSFPDVGVLSSFVLPPVAFTFSFKWQAAQQKAPISVC